MCYTKLTLIPHVRDREETEQNFVGTVYRVFNSMISVY
jgi:hypothetical protein